jgi:hypothetical protein
MLFRTALQSNPFSLGGCIQLVRLSSKALSKDTASTKGPGGVVVNWDGVKIPLTLHPDAEGPRSDPYQMEHFKYWKKRYIPERGDTRDIGPYPNIPMVSDQLRPRYPDTPYDDPQLRRYIGEPIQEYGDSLSMWYPTKDTPYSLGFMLKGLFGFFGTLLVLFYISFKLDDPYLRAMAVPRTLYTEDPYIRKILDGGPFKLSKPWPNTKDYMIPMQVNKQD